MGLRESKIGDMYLSFMDKTVLGWLKKKNLGPNTVTLAGLAIACFVPLGFALSPWAGFALIGVSGVADSLDGSLARATQQQSVFGSFWDSTLDRAADCAYLLGFLVLFWPFAGWWRLMAVIILFLALLGTLLISYTKAKIESLGQNCHSGIMSRPARIVFLLVWALLLALIPVAHLEMLWLGLGLYVALTAFTVGQRIVEARRVLAG
jgi:CDP-diacylglycerol--glycerol-3-phosphate 3-phosphatidyltransferase